MKYDESQDQSERFGWKKVKDEPPRCEKEQRLWGHITVVIGVLMAATTLIYAY